MVLELELVMMVLEKGLLRHKKCRWRRDVDAFKDKKTALQPTKC